MNTIKAGNQRVLLVDDSEGIVNFLAIKLKVSGYDLVCTTDAEKGLELAQNTHPDIVLLDLAMPNIDGAEVLRRLRRFSSIPAIILTARDRKNEEVMSIGATAFVSKPFNAYELMAKIKVTLQSGCSK